MTPIPRLPLNKTMDPIPDFALLAEECHYVDRYPWEGAELRRWEYAMALHAAYSWATTTEAFGRPLLAYDVGGNGSPLGSMLYDLAGVDTRIVDPLDATSQKTVEQLAMDPRQHATADILCAISVIEHVAYPSHFFRACFQLLKPGGLLFLTTDCWHAEGPDTTHFHWMRTRIYNPDKLRKLVMEFKGVARRFGQTDWSNHGIHLYGPNGYTFASVCARKLCEGEPA